MSDSHGLVDCWQGMHRNLGYEYDDDATFESAASGTEYDAEELTKRMEKEILMMLKGDYPETAADKRPVPRITDDEGNYILRDLIDQEWYDLTLGEERYGGGELHIPGKNSQGNTFVNYYPEEESLTPPRDGS